MNFCEFVKMAAETANEYKALIPQGDESDSTRCRTLCETIGLHFSLCFKKNGEISEKKTAIVVQFSLKS